MSDINLRDPQIFRSQLAEAQRMEAEKPPIADDAGHDNDLSTPADEAEQGLETSVKPKNHDQTIPLTRLNKEIKKREQLSQELERERTEKQQLIERLSEIESAIREFAETPNKTNQNDAQEAVDELEFIDPKAHQYYSKQIEALKNELNEFKTERQKELEQKKTQQQMQAEIFKKQQAIAEQEKDFAQIAPDYMEAFEYLREQKVKELTYGAKGRNRQYAEETAMYYLQTIADAALSNGDSVPEALYEMAKVCGYQPKQADQSFQKRARNTNAITSHELPSAATLTDETQSYLSKDGFKRLLNQSGRVDPEKFRDALRKLNR